MYDWVMARIESDEFGQVRFADCGLLQQFRKFVS